MNPTQLARELLDLAKHAEGLGDSSAASWVRVCFRAALRTLVMEVGK